MEEEDLVNSSPNKTKNNINSKPSPASLARSIKSSKKITPMSLYSNVINNNRYENTGLGQSRYDEGFNLETDLNQNDVQGSINEHRYENQGWGTQLAAGVARAGVKAATEVAKLPGVVVGLAAAPFAKEGEGYDTAFNNQWIKTLDGINQDINTEALPVYVGKAIKEGNIWDNITSTSFWATDGADGIGYMLAMMAPGAALNKLGVGAKLIGGARNAAGALGMTQKTEAAVSALKALGVTGKAVDIGVGAVANTLFESGAEAAGVGNDLDTKKPEIIEGYKAQPDYNQKVFNKLEQLDQQRRTGQITLDEYNKLSSTAQDDVAEEMFKEQRALAMRDTFKSNLAILIIPNLLMSKSLFGKAESNLVKQAEKTGIKAIGERAGKSLGRVGEAFISEGLIEEAGQTTAQNLFTRKAAEGSLERDGDVINDFTLGEATEGYIDTVSSTEGLKAIFLGGILGGPMMSIQGRKGDVENRKASNEILSRTGEALDSYNTIFENDIYEKGEDGGYKYIRGADGRFTGQRVTNNANVIKVANALNLKENESKRFEQALQEGNQDVVDEIKAKAIFDLITPTIYNEQLGLDALEAKLIENEAFQTAQENMNVTKTKKSSEENIKEILETAKYLQGQNEKFQDFGNDLIKLNNPKASSQDRTDFINAINTQYVKVKYDQHLSEKKLKVLENKRSQILNELNLDKGLVLEDEISVKAEENSPLLKENADQIRKTTESINKNKKDVNELWSGNTAINKSFDQYVNRNEKLREYASDENAAKADVIIEALKNPNIVDVKELDKIKTDNKEFFSKYPLLEQIHIERTQEVINTKKAEIQTRKDDKEAEIVSNEIITPTNGSNTNIPTTNGIPLEESTESIQNDQQVEVEPISEDEYTPVENAPIENPQVEDTKDKGAARVISTIQATGEPIKGLESYVEYERDPRDKTNDKVTFEVGDRMSDRVKEIYNNIISGKATSGKNELYNNLPIKVNITDGNYSASSYIDAMTSNSSEIVAKETLPLRKAIIDAFIANKGSFEGITGKIKNQLPGVLKIENKEKGDSVAKNNIFELDVFQDMTEDQKIFYFQKNTAYVNFAGRLLSTVTGKEIVEKGNIDTQNKGEVFLKIPRANGTAFWLKLNTNIINENQSNDLFELILLKFRITNGEDISLSQLKDLISTESLKNEINLITKNVEFRADATVNKLIDLLIFNGNQNPVSKFGLYFKNHTIIGKNGERFEGETGVQVGLLFNKIMNDGNLYRQQITANELLENTEYYKNAFLKFFKYKRHNILINNPDFNFKNKNYIKYLLDNENPILTTNAVVNQPTFQGYSNIYLEQTVNNSNIKPTQTEVEDKKIITKSKVKISDGSQIKPEITTKPEQVSAFGTNPNIENIPDSKEVVENILKTQLGVNSKIVKQIYLAGRNYIETEDGKYYITSDLNDGTFYDSAVEVSREQIIKPFRTQKEWKEVGIDTNKVSDKISPTLDEEVEDDLQVKLDGLKKLQSLGLDKSKEIAETEALLKNKSSVVKEIKKVVSDTNNGKITAEYLNELADSDIDGYLNTLTNIQNKYPFITNEIMDKGNAEIAEQLKNNVVDIEELKKNCQ